MQECLLLLWSYSFLCFGFNLFYFYSTEKEVYIFTHKYTVHVAYLQVLAIIGGNLTCYSINHYFLFEMPCETLTKLTSAVSLTLSEKQRKCWNLTTVGGKISLLNDLNLWGQVFEEIAYSWINNNNFLFCVLCYSSVTEHGFVWFFGGGVFLFPCCGEFNVPQWAFLKVGACLFSSWLFANRNHSYGKCFPIFLHETRCTFLLVSVDFPHLLPPVSLTIKIRLDFFCQLYV